MSNIRGLFDGKKEEDSDDDSKKGSNNRFVGGINAHGGGSGLAVEPNSDDAGSSVGRNTQDSIFNLAEQSGHAEGGSDTAEAVRRTITMYRDGFMVDDGPYRRLDDPANAGFLRALAMGQTPPELMDDAGPNGITVGLIDKRSEEYVETFRSFSGTGNSLGNNSEATATSSDRAVVFDPTSFPNTTPTAVDESQPTTSIAVRLPNGQRKVVKLNLTMTVMQLAAHVGAILPDPATPFRIVAGFPPKPLEDVAATIEAAGLKGAQVQITKV